MKRSQIIVALGIIMAFGIIAPASEANSTTAPNPL